MRLKKMPRFLPHFLFFIVGFITPILGAFANKWIHAFMRSIGLERLFQFDLPSWLSFFVLLFGVLPLIAFAIAIGLRLYVGQRFRLFSFTAGLIAPYFLIYGLLKYGPALQEYWHQQPFDAATWRSAREDCSSSWTTRITMVDDLMQSNQLRGKTKSEVEALLGQSDDFSNIEPFGGRQTDDTKWDIGYCLGLRAWSHPLFIHWLMVKIGPDGKVQKISFASDYRIP